MDISKSFLRELGWFLAYLQGRDKEAADKLEEIIDFYERPTGGIYENGKWVNARFVEVVGEPAGGETVVKVEKINKQRRGTGEFLCVKLLHFGGQKTLDEINWYLRREGVDLYKDWYV